MLTIALSALLPVAVTLFVGYIAAWHHDFDSAHAAILNRMVMSYALPLMLFAGTVQILREELASNLPLAASIAGSMLGVFLATFAVARWGLRRDPATAVLQVLIVSVPAIPFVGTTVLGNVVGSLQSVLPIAAGTLALNLVMAPLGLLLLTFATAPEDRKGGLGAGLSILMTALREPVVWAPMAAIVLVITGVRLLQFVDQSLVLLGNASAGVALFATGIVMFCRSVSLTPTVAVNVLARMVVVPALVWLAMAGLDLSVASLREAVLVMALPAAALPVIFAVRFQTAQQEMASTLFYANIAAIPTLGAFIWLTSDGNLAKM